MKILALDLATVTGFAHSSGPSGVWDLRIKKDESSGMRLIRFENKLREVLNGPGIDLIVFEAVSVGSGPKANMDGIKLSTKLQAIIERMVEKKEGIECSSYNLSQIKAHAIPKKGASRNKEAMVGAAEKRWPDVEVIDDNHADALWLLDLAITDLGLSDV